MIFSGRKRVALPFPRKCVFREPQMHNFSPFSAKIYIIDDLGGGGGCKGAVPQVIMHNLVLIYREI